MNSAQLRLMQKRLAQVKQHKREVIVDTADVPANIGPYAGHKAGKRRRGVSVTKRKPRSTAVTIKYVMRDEYGNILSRFDTLTIKHDPS